MASQEPVSVRMFGALNACRRECGLPSECELEIPQEGRSARDIAADLRLPLDRIEGVFHNRVVRDLAVTIKPGDRIAFVPKGTPGPHRYFLGLYEAGQEGGVDE